MMDDGSAYSQVCKSGMKKTGSTSHMGRDTKKSGLKSDMSAGMSDKSKSQVNGYSMGSGNGRGNY